jgi:acetylornithine deacetylase/succinyl-diaminopimelate desuccinylase-like protein
MLLRLVERQIMDAVDRYQPLTVSETFSTKVRLRRQPTPFLWAKVDESFNTAMENPTIRDVPYNTEAQLYVNAGSQALILGPGSIKEAHHENEFVSERWLQPDVTERYTAIIRAMCG